MLRAKLASKHMNPYQTHRASIVSVLAPPPIPKPARFFKPMIRALRLHMRGQHNQQTSTARKMRRPPQKTNVPGLRRTKMRQTSKEQKRAKKERQTTAKQNTRETSPAKTTRMASTDQQKRSRPPQQKKRARPPQQRRKRPASTGMTKNNFRPLRRQV